MRRRWIRLSVGLAGLIMLACVVALVLIASPLPDIDEPEDVFGFESANAPMLQSPRTCRS